MRHQEGQYHVPAHVWLDTDCCGKSGNPGRMAWGKRKRQPLGVVAHEAGEIQCEGVVVVWEGTPHVVPLFVAVLGQVGHAAPQGELLPRQCGPSISLTLKQARVLCFANLCRYRPLYLC